MTDEDFYFPGYFTWLAHNAITAVKPVLSAIGAALRFVAIVATPWVTMIWYPQHYGFFVIGWYGLLLFLLITAIEYGEAKTAAKKKNADWIYVEDRNAARRRGR